jgi:mono/diheme cytochrome c family protein
MKHAALLLLFAMAPMASAGAQDISAASGVFTDADAQRGQATYVSRCANCHGRNLETSGDSPSLKGESFALGWKGKTLAERFQVIKETMPPSNPGSLEDGAVLNIMAFILKTNGYPSGATPLTTDSPLDRIVVPR